MTLKNNNKPIRLIVIDEKSNKDKQLIDYNIELCGVPPAPRGIPHLKGSKWTIDNIYYEGHMKYNTKYDYRFVKSEHLIDGSVSKIPVWCKMCEDIFFTDINHHFSRLKRGCQRCANQLRWTAERIRSEGPKIHPYCNYDYVLPEHITNGVRSEIPVYCTICEKMFMTTPINHLTCNKTECPRCAGKELWTVERIRCDGPIVYPNGIYNYSLVKEEHITKGNKSKIPVLCNMCNEIFTPSISDHLVSRKSGCQRCSNHVAWTAERIHEEGKKLHPDGIYIYTHITAEHITEGAKSKIPIWCTKCQDFFWQTINSHFSVSKCGCPPCSKRGYSKVQIEWLEHMMVMDKTFIQHARNAGEYLIPGTKYHADGYSPQLNKIYEFHGDYWHGNPNKYRRDDFNGAANKTMGELYDKTMKKHEAILALGYVLEFIWEDDWNQSKTRYTPTATDIITTNEPKFNIME